MYRRRHLRLYAMTILFVIIVVVGIALSFTGCAELKSIFNRTKENLVGRSFTITQYDHYGNATMELKGDSVAVGLLENNSNFDSEATGFESEVLEFTIDQNQVFTVGDTCIIAEDGIDLITDYDMDTTIDNSDGKMTFMIGDRLVNDLKNSFGKEMVVVVKSQLGIPIGVYQGDEVYVSVPDDLPKTTLITIDGKSLYIHRANYTILDAEMVK